MNYLLIICSIAAPKFVLFVAASSLASSLSLPNLKKVRNLAAICVISEFAIIFFHFLSRVNLKWPAPRTKEMSPESINNGHLPARVGHVSVKYHVYFSKYCNLVHTRHVSKSIHEVSVSNTYWTQVWHPKWSISALYNMKLLTHEEHYSYLILNQQ